VRGFFSIAFDFPWDIPAPQGGKEKD